MLISHMLSEEIHPSHLSELDLNLLFHSSRDLASSMPRVLYVPVQQASAMFFQTQIDMETYQ